MFLVKPVNSIVMQSLHARESTIPTNGDGFGLGWYVPSISVEPALFMSISPAWNDRNLLHLTAKIKSPCFFAHVRAASSGGVANYNCHPFIHEQWMLMHNGRINDFIVIKRHLRHLLEVIT
jgi:glutamine amidotransferase